MATFNFYKPSDMLGYGVWEGYITNATSSNITISDNAGQTASYDGFFSYSGDDLTGGTLTAITETTDYSLQYAITGLSLSAVAVKDYILSGDAMGLVTYAASGNDVFNGSYGADFIGAFGGNDTINGAGGIDMALYQGSKASYTIQSNVSGFTVADSAFGRDGSDTLVQVERLAFFDCFVALDVAGNGGQAYRLYQAAFDRTPDVGGLGYQMTALDNGYSLSQVAGNFIASPEFQATYGPLDNTAFVTQLYANVLNRAPDAGGLSYHVNNLNAGMMRADVLVGFSESPENQANVIGAIQNGMIYTL